MAEPIEDNEKHTSWPKDLRRPLRVLVCPDTPGWAFDNIANNIMHHAPDYIHVTKHFMGDPAKRDLSVVFEQLAVDNIDVLHLFWREDLFELLRPTTLLAAAERLKIPLAEAVEIISSRALTTSVYDHLHLNREQILERIHSYHLIDAYSVSSEKLNTIYSSISEFPPPNKVITDGVNLGLFKPSKTPRQRDLTRPVIGWVGNSAWGSSEDGDPKGFHRLFLPAMEILKQMNVPFQVDAADSQGNRRKFSEMPNYYHTIDILACTSSMEGTPNPVLEAMASGVAIVSSDVGIVGQTFGTEQSKFIVNNPTPELFAHAIKKLISDEHRYKEICNENLSQIQSWSWEHTTAPWWPFWLSAGKQAAEPRMTHRRSNSLIQSCESYQRYINQNPVDAEPAPKPRSIFNNIWPGRRSKE